MILGSRQNADTLKSLPIAQKDKTVTLRLGSGEDLSSAVKAMNGYLV